MWDRASSCIAGTIGMKHTIHKPSAHQYSTDCSDDEVSSVTSRDEGRDEGLECPICWESFNLVENIPYVLWCGHTLCKNCILGLQWAVIKFPNLPLQLPLVISCPWCNLLSLRLIYRGNLKSPCKNFFLLWMLESMNGDRLKFHSPGICGDHNHQQLSHVKASNILGRGQFCHRHYHSGHSVDSDRGGVIDGNYNYFFLERLNMSLRKSLMFFVNLTAKFPLVIIFILIVLYAIPASAAILALYVLITVLFALPSFLILYFAYPSLDWLVREIMT